MSASMKWIMGLSVRLVFLGAVGCGTGSGDTTGGGTTSSTGSGVSPCDDPTVGPVAESCGVWVSASKGDDANAGTQAAPVASLNHAIELARQGTGRVYACSEYFSNEPVVLPGNIGLHGGFDCWDHWKYLGRFDRSIVAPPPDVIPLLATDSGDSSRAGESLITDFRIEAAGAVQPGGSSIAMLVRDNVTLSLYRCRVLAGNGADGINGIHDKPAKPGPDGNNGADACSASATLGGASPEVLCETGATSKGGKGGDSGPMTAENGAAGEPASGNPQQGAAGLGEKNTPTCTDGTDGANGVNGSFGLGATTDTLFTVDGCYGPAGKDGSPGTPGQGGGGGGARFGSAAVCGGAKSGGAAGGSGGAGGCGGKGGTGGGPGGASIALIARNRVYGFDTILTARRGGKGGDGARGQQGGAPGGSAGHGGAGKGSLEGACSGGRGGFGGDGGFGGGGKGGAAFPAAYLKKPGQAIFLVLEGESDFDLGTPGEGGKGDPDVAATFGQTGNVATVWNFGP